MTENPTTEQERADLTDMLTEAAAALVSSTYPAPQSDQIIHGLTQAYNVDAEVVILPTLVLSQTHRTTTPQMRVVNSSYRFDQMFEAQNVMAQARHSQHNPHDIAEGLRNIALKKPIYPGWLRVLGYALSALGFGAAFRIDLPGLIGVTVMGLIIGTMVLNLSKIPRFNALLPLLATFAAGLMVAGASLILDKPDPVRLVAIPVLVLLPGAALTSAIIELVSGYMVSGSSRLVFAVMILGAMAFGGALAITASGISGSRLEDVTATMTPAWVAWVGAAIYGIGTFLYFCTPLHMWIPSLSVMILSFAISVLAQPSLGTPLAAGIATAVGLIAAWGINARLGGGPGDLAIFLPTFWLIVPGSTGFVAMTGAIESAKDLSDVAAGAGLTFFSMAIGMMVATAVFPLLTKIAPDTKLIMKRGAGLITNIPLVRQTKGGK
jgi:uncharacterized membrane protein YjjP (DUF1212 family)